MVTKSAVIGIDLGASESYVAYVGKGIVDIVQNEVSKRNTPTLVGFTDRERLLGDTALSQIRSNALNTCRNFKHLLGRKLESPDVQNEHFWSTAKLTSTDDGFCGYSLNYKGEHREFSATEITAMFLTKLKEVTEKWCQAKVADAVISAPSYYSDIQRQALLDAAKIAGISVLRVMNEHTATALAYGIYRSNDFDPEKPMTVAFCSMGHTIFSVSIVQFVRGKLTVLCEKSDKVGGRDMDECLMREFAGQFKKKVGCDPLGNKKAGFKLEDAVTKTKKILSANSEAGCTVECLMEDEDFGSQINRSTCEKMCIPMIERAKAVLEGAKAMVNMPHDKLVESIDAVELIGGMSRVPWVKQVCSEAFGGKELSTTMNQEESVARGCALQAAILSPLYKVREFKVEDTSPFAINVGWMGSASDTAAMKEEEDGDAQMAASEGEYKTATVFPASSTMNVMKLMTFYRTGPFDLKAEYADEKLLLPGTPKDLGTFRIELPQQPEPKKVKVKAKLTLHGTFTIESAQMVEEEEYDETVKEKRELPPDPAEENGKEEAKDKEDEDTVMKSDDGEAQDEEVKAEAATDEKEVEKSPTPVEKSPTGEEESAKSPEVEEVKGPEKRKEPEKRYEWVDVVKKKKRTKRTDINITATNRPGLSDAIIQKRMDEETAMQAEMREIIETDERRNDLESYIFTTRDKICEHNAYGPFIAGIDRDKFTNELTKAEDWLYDNPDSKKMQYIEKLDELKCTGDVVVWRYKEHSMRAEWIAAVSGTVANYRAAADSPGDKYGHINPEKLGKITAACNELEKWLTDMGAKQETLPKHEKPVLICADMEKKNQELAKMADEILKEPKPAPPKAEKKAEPKEAPEPEKDEAMPDKAAEKPNDDGPVSMDVDVD